MDLINKSIIQLNNENNKIELDLKFIETDEFHGYDNQLYLILTKYKSMIDKVYTQKTWDFCKKLSNECELLHIILKNKPQNLGIANYDPISRAFFKMWEIISDFNIVDINENKIIYAALAEGPGGFIECFNYYRRKHNKGKDDKIKCMTLKSNNADIPGWKKSQRIINECSECDVSYGEDGTGDLLNRKNIEHFIELFNESKADLLTADGGFDFSDNYANQESSAFQLIYCEIITGLGVLKLGGHMVIKIYDIMHTASLDLIYLLTKYFKNIFITKPNSSRSANSEKYIICKGFLGIDKTELKSLLELVDEFNILKSQNKQITRILKNEIPKQFMDVIQSLNIHFISRQIKSILKIVSYTTLNLTNQDINEIKKEQTVYSIAWCAKYDFPINFRCRYLKQNNQYNFIPNF